MRSWLILVCLTCVSARNLLVESDDNDEVGEQGSGCQVDEILQLENILVHLPEDKILRYTNFTKALCRQIFSSIQLYPGY